MENADGDLRRALDGPILVRRLLESPVMPFKNLQNLTHTNPITAFVDFETAMYTQFGCVLVLFRRSEF